MRWIIPEPLVPRQEDRRLGERDCIRFVRDIDLNGVHFVRRVSLGILD